MKIQYQDEYGEIIFEADDAKSSILPNTNDSVLIDDEDWSVVSRTFVVAEDTVVIGITQNKVSKKVAESSTPDRHRETARSIIELSNRQDAAEKKHRMLSEQVVSIRQHINQRIQKDKKHDDSR